MFLSIGMLKLNYFLADIFILSAEKQPIKLSWRKIECLPNLSFTTDSLSNAFLKKRTEDSYDSVPKLFIKLILL